jgi:uncharacterized SAM-binding protein YcdF (DUF218 family)
MRLVAVLGYSDGTTEKLHAICASRLERAADEVTAEDTVLLSGWARGLSRRSEARLMADAWPGPPARIVVDEGARSTYANAVRAAATALELGADEIVVVTSGWHARRADTLVRAAFRGQSRRVTVAATRERGSRRARIRELACWPAVPVQIVLARRNR